MNKSQITFEQMKKIINLLKLDKVAMLEFSDREKDLTVPEVILNVISQASGKTPEELKSLLETQSKPKTENSIEEMIKEFFNLKDCPKGKQPEECETQCDCEKQKATSVKIEDLISGLGTLSVNPLTAILAQALKEKEVVNVFEEVSGKVKDALHKFAKESGLIVEEDTNENEQYARTDCFDEATLGNQEKQTTSKSPTPEVLKGEALDVIYESLLAEIKQKEKWTLSFDEKYVEHKQKPIFISLVEGYPIATLNKKVKVVFGKSTQDKSFLIQEEYFVDAVEKLFTLKKEALSTSQANNLADDFLKLLQG